MTNQPQGTPDALTRVDLSELEGFTPGPWKMFAGAGPTINVHSARRKEIVHWAGFDSSDCPPKERLANARLIAQAPAMLAELRQLRAAVPAEPTSPGDTERDAERWREVAAYSQVTIADGKLTIIHDGIPLPILATHQGEEGEFHDYDSRTILPDIGAVPRSALGSVHIDRERFPVAKWITQFVDFARASRSPSSPQTEK